MKIDQLKEGNVVLVEDTFFVSHPNHFIACKIINVGTEVVLAEAIGKNSIRGAGARAFKSISDIKYYPLSKELFDFLGFKKSKNFLLDSEVFYLRIDEDKELEIIECQKGFVYRKLEYIMKNLHELQNLYFEDMLEEIRIDLLPDIIHV